MTIRKALAALTVMSLLIGVPALAFADDGAPEAPPAGVVMPKGDTPPPPPPPGEVRILVPPQPGVTTPIFPTGQPGNVAPDPYADTHPDDFDRAVRTARMGTGPCAPCRPVCSPCDPCAADRRDSRGYGGFSLGAYPGLGFGVEFGVWFARSSFADWALEMNLNYQDLTDEFNAIDSGQGGKWINTRIGVKASLLPCGNSHPVFRGGFGWAVESGDAGNDLDIGEIPGSLGQTNYFGGYVGVGWEWDLFDGCVTTGPEVWAWAGYPENGADWGWTATVAWHFLFNF